MRRRVYAAFDLGLRANEILRLQLKAARYGETVSIQYQTREPGAIVIHFLKH